MPIIKNGKTVTAIYKGNKPIIKIFKGLQVVWEAFKKLLVSGIPPLKLNNSVGENLENYKIYGNSTQEAEPTPSKPKKVKSVGDKTANLAPKLTDMTKNGVSLTVESDGTITLNGTCTASENFVSEKFYLGDNTYSLSDFAYGDFGDNSFVRSQIYSPSSSKDIAIANNTDPDYVRSVALYSANDYVVRIRIQKGHTYNNCKLKIMLVVGEYTKNTMPPYVPFGYKIPVTVGGKNLFNKANTSSIVTNLYPNSAVFATGTVWRGCILKCKPNTTYTLSKIAGQTCYLGSSSEYPANGVTINVREYIPTGESATITTGENDKYISAFFYRTNVDTINYQTVLDTVQVEMSDVATSYYEYVEPTTTNIFLDEPLRKIGDYSDYIDFENKKIVRNIYEYKITGNEQYYLCDTDSIRTQFELVPQIKRITETSSLFIGYACSHNPFIENSYKYLTTYSYQDPTSLEFRKIVDNWGVSEYTVDAWKTFVQAEVTKGTPVTIDYVTETPTEEPIELPEIPTINGTTILEVDTEIEPSNMEVIYKGKV